MNRTQLVRSIEKKFPNQWLLIDITREDRYHEPLVGRLLLKSKSKQALVKALPRFGGSVYLTYSGRPLAHHFVLNTIEV
jgi:hypothetical protein